jgi:hypothetical protein
LFGSHFSYAILGSADGAEENGMGGFGGGEGFIGQGSAVGVDRALLSSLSEAVGSAQKKPEICFRLMVRMLGTYSSKEMILKIELDIF